MSEATVIQSAIDMGIVFKREIPKGDEFVSWLLDDIGIPEFARALRAPDLPDREGLLPASWDEMAWLVFQSSMRRWAPTAERLEALAEA